jgi:hypothetical protein
VLFEPEAHAPKMSTVDAAIVLDETTKLKIDAATVLMKTKLDEERPLLDHKLGEQPPAPHMVKQVLVKDYGTDIICDEKDMPHEYWCAVLAYANEQMGPIAIHPWSFHQNMSVVNTKEGEGYTGDNDKMLLQFRARGANIVISV